MDDFRIVNMAAKAPCPVKDTGSNSSSSAVGSDGDPDYMGNSHKKSKILLLMQGITYIASYHNFFLFCAVKGCIQILFSINMVLPPFFH